MENIEPRIYENNNYINIDQIEFNTNFDERIEHFIKFISFRCL